ncbi:uncharacterized protein STEHIDRAFT_129517 [Stereum hirsutum FP-91666 SS1]|uniref:uncharacterized protein n=1 Tax=Stereum hirsutum (strain FP-91666) TaxID=721885 RepID=UPI000440F8AD|nr:uncharacterized protein STEHIDRAFT_129517 [Stereum hirsutum FP-91666 SS1]EIM88930.1 hypothetical protein STEHIDRAFT_129517 [Stereum hirsutum FP-91666 SS1]
MGAGHLSLADSSSQALSYAQSSASWTHSTIAWVSPFLDGRQLDRLRMQRCVALTDRGTCFRRRVSVPHPAPGLGRPERKAVVENGSPPVQVVQNKQCLSVGSCKVRTTLPASVSSHLGL